MAASEEGVRQFGLGEAAEHSEVGAQRIAIARPVSYIDATHLTPKERRPYIEIGRRYGCPVDALFFDVPVAVCKQRNAGRTRIVPDDAIDRMAAKLVPPTRKEGFARVTRWPL